MLRWGAGAGQRRRLAERENDDYDDTPEGISAVTAQQAKLLAHAFAQLGTGQRWKLISFAQDLVAKS